MMADEPNNIVLEHLRHIRRVVDKLETDVTERRRLRVRQDVLIVSKDV